MSLSFGAGTVIGMNEVIVSVKHFSLTLGSKEIVSDLSFNVKKGEIFGFLGANGSGKTTTIRALLGIYRPTAGELLIKGKPYDVSRDIKLGYLPEERGLYKKEKVIDTMIYFGQLKGMEKAAAREWSLEFLKRVELIDKSTMRLDKLSGGQQQKIQLGITIMNDPELLILDEPTKGFDPVNRRLLMDIVEEHQQKGASVIFVTHQMEEVERLCHRILLLKDGKSRLYDTVDEAKEAFGGSVIEVISEKPAPMHPSLYQIQRKEGKITTLLPHGDTADIQSALVDAKLSMTKFELKRPSLDDIFVSIYGDTKQEEKNV